MFRDFQVEATAFLHEILAVADNLRDARSLDGEPALHLGPRWRLLRAIERCGGAPTFSDLGRLLGMSRQAAREIAFVPWGRIYESVPTPGPRGRKELEAQRMPKLAWLLTVLSGLEPPAMRATNHVLRVIRLRLERYERDRCRSVSAASARRW